MVEPLELGEVPFYWRVKKTPTQPPHDIPARLPFSFTFLSELQLVIQQRNPSVLQWLERVYTEDANVGYLQDGHALAESYGGEFIDFFQRASALLRKKPASAADIGCGGVYLLQKVREQGLAVKGIDPSPVTSAAGKKVGIEIVPDFYPSPSLTERFDVLFHYDVLEHVEDPVAFLRAHHGNLSSDGALIFAVPDCSHHIALGDVSMLLHEHLNYFDEDSLARVVRAAGFEPLRLEPARHGGVLLCCAVPAASHASPIEPAKDDSKFLEFRQKAQAALHRFSALARQSMNDELGLYVPLRAFPYLGQLSPETKLRFFDDDPGLRGRYYDGFDVAIENRDELAARPPERVMVCSLAFGDKIAARLREKKINNLRIVLWSDLFDGVAG
ncbi:class I SAM-dependent methyltransferase [Herbaspirillum sp.]|uniref:class I SAM-dependent methyltransferase n=1 Tax=Herbaspirillum sp. TaxID=1890675 RepID=UPI001B1740C3|nr:class I SAM-dependent methyltransferase [Herbaspirillum sp.]MBO9536967.1 class I SAM-dependent methyltransferase [Herbaspirillum sp.]